MKIFNRSILGCILIILSSCKEPRKNEENKEYPDKKQEEVIQQESSAENILAIDVLLNPGEKMLEKAGEYNTRLRKEFPEGFALDASHAPHITIIQAYVKERDLGKIENELEKMLRNFNLKELDLQAKGLYYIPFEDKGLAGITIKKEELMDFHKQVISMMETFSVNDGTGAAFVARPDGEEIMEATVEYVNNFKKDSSGEKFNPHVTIGVASQDFLEQMLNEPFEEFKFNIESVGIYQLGEMGTAQKELGRIQLTPPE